MVIQSASRAFLPPLMPLVAMVRLAVVPDVAWLDAALLGFADEPGAAEDACAALLCAADVPDELAPPLSELAHPDRARAAAMVVATASMPFRDHDPDRRPVCCM